MNKTFFALTAAAVVSIGVTGCTGDTAQVSGGPNTFATEPTPAPVDITKEPGVLMASGGFNVAEDQTFSSITVIRSGDKSTSMSVNYRTVDSTAISGKHFHAKSGVLTWNANENESNEIMVELIDDNIEEGDRTFFVELFNASGGIILFDDANRNGIRDNAEAGYGRVNITILDNDAGSVQEVTAGVQMANASFNVSESSSSSNITVVRTGDISSPARVSYRTKDLSAISANDYQNASGTLEWEEGDSTSRTIVVPLIDDDQIDDDVSFIVELFNPIATKINFDDANGNNTKEVTESLFDTTVVSIFNDDTVEPVQDLGNSGLQLSFSSVNVSEDVPTVKLTAVRTGDSSEEASVSFRTIDGTAQAGVSYEQESGTFYWAGGQSESRDITVKIINDTLFGENLDFTVDLFGAHGATVNFNDVNENGVMDDGEDNYGLTMVTILDTDGPDRNDDGIPDGPDPGTSPDTGSNNPDTPMDGIYKGEYSYKDQTTNADVSISTFGFVTKAGEALIAMGSDIRDGADRVMRGVFWTNDDNLFGNYRVFAEPAAPLDDGTLVADGILSGQASEHEFLYGFTEDSAENGTLQQNYQGNLVYETISSLELASAVWGFDRTDGYSLTLAVGDYGDITGHDSEGCRYDGMAGLINPERNLYDMQLNVSNCPDEGAYDGLFYVFNKSASVPGNDMYLIFANENRGFSGEFFDRDVSR